MSRRRKRDNDWIGPLAQLAGVIVLLSMISPLMRQTLAAIGFVSVCVLGIGIVGLIGFGIYRFATRSHEPEILQSTLAPEISLPVTPRPERVITQSTPSFIEQLRTIDWFQFEKLVALLYRKQGYSVTRRGGANPDGGIDLIIEKDGQQLAVQCKQWKTWNVGVKSVREFLGALTDAGIQKGIFITLCGYTGEAKQLAVKHGIEIVNETGLAQMLESTDARFDPETLDILRDTQKICPKCERPMVLRTATKGPGAGQRFWGCSAFPKCRFRLQETAGARFSRAG